MPKSITARNIAGIRSLRFLVENGGAVQGLEVTAEVNYGTLGMAETIDLFPKLSASQRAAAQALYDRVKALLESEYLA